MRRRAFTLFEILFVIGIIGVLIGVLLPAIQGAREQARRYQCSNHLRQLLIAVQNYEHLQQMYPAGTQNPTAPITTQAKGYHHSWISQILPMLEETNVYRQIDFRLGVYDPKNARARSRSLPCLTCPSDFVQVGVSSYAGVHHHLEAPIDATNSGTFILNRQIRRRELVDGLGYTALIGEKVIEWGNDLGWMSGTRATLRNMGTPLNVTGHRRRGGPGYFPEGEGVGSVPPLFYMDPEESAGLLGGEEEYETVAEMKDSVVVVGLVGGMAATLEVGGFSSRHGGGVNFGFADGSVRMLHESISLDVLSRLGHRNDGQLVQFDKAP